MAYIHHYYFGEIKLPLSLYCSPLTLVVGCGNSLLDMAELHIPRGAALIGRDGRRGNVEGAVAVIARWQHEGVRRYGYLRGIGNAANDVFQARAVVEGLTSDERHSIRNGYRLEENTSVKGGVTDGCDRSRYDCVAAAGNQCASGRLDNGVTSLAGIVIGITARNRHTCERRTLPECRASNRVD